jgi:hypothetical protein
MNKPMAHTSSIDGKMILPKTNQFRSLSMAAPPFDLLK